MAEKKTGAKKTSSAKKAAPKKKAAASAKKAPAKKKATSSPRAAQNAAPTHDDIARRAYEIHEREGGNHEENWLRAERELKKG
ncbi:MAG TPA: DUF2934 domain-containing protein [Thermoleophilaceae bacterium]